MAERFPRHGTAQALQEYAKGQRSVTKPASKMPKGGQQSPTGDIGELRQLEALKVFPVLQKMTDHVKRISRRIPTPKGWITK